jgi:hypothetical protein
MSNIPVRHLSATLGLLLALVLSAATTLRAESKNPADYPLRLHIFTNSGVTFYHNRVEEEMKGDGRANLFESSEAHGVDFTFECDRKIKTSFGYETYPAKWKKQGKELLVLFPVIGKANNYFTCTLKTDVKPYAYFRRSSNELASESVEQYKRWMVAHDYDPEHGKNTPTSGASSPLDEARQLLTGPNKDFEKATTLLNQVLVPSAKSMPDQLAWAYIYLGYIADRSGNRQSAIAAYQKAVAVNGIPTGARDVAQSGLKQPLTWIRHLDAGEKQ